MQNETLDGRIDIYLDAGFKDFYKFCKENDIPVVIVSRYLPSADRTLNSY